MKLYFILFLKFCSYTFLYSQESRHFIGDSIEITYNYSEVIQNEMTIKNLIDSTIKVFIWTSDGDLVNYSESLYFPRNRHGIRLDYQNNKLIFSGSYFNNKPHGVIREYDRKNGNLIYEQYFRMGLKSGLHREWDSSGNLLLEQNYSNGKLDGFSKEKYPNGNLMSSTFYINGKRFGLALTYYEDGEIEKRSEYVNGKKNGVVINYYRNGNINRTYYNMGEKIKGESPPK